MKESFENTFRKQTVGTFRSRKDIILDSGLKLDEEQENFLLYGATDEQFEEMIEHLKQR